MNYDTQFQLNMLSLKIRDRFEDGLSFSDQAGPVASEQFRRPEVRRNAVRKLLAEREPQPNIEADLRQWVAMKWDLDMPEARRPTVYVCPDDPDDLDLEGLDEVEIEDDEDDEEEFIAWLFDTDEEDRDDLPGTTSAYEVIHQRRNDGGTDDEEVVF